MTPPHGSHHDEIARIEAVRSALARGREPKKEAVVPAVYYPVATAPPAPLEDADSPHLLYEFGRLLAKHKWTLLAFTLICLLGGYFLSHWQQRQYRATATMEVLGYNENFLNTRELDPNATGSNFFLDSYVETMVKIIQSDGVLDRVGKRLKLTEVPEFQDRPGRFAALKEALDLDPGATRLTPSEAMRQHLRTNLRIKSSRTDRIIEVQYVAANSALAAEVANTLANEFIKQESEAHWQTTERTAEFLDRSLSDLKRKMQDAEQALQAYAKSADIVFTNDTDTVAEARLRQVQDELSKAEAERMAKQSLYELVTTSPIESLPTVLENGTLKDYNVKLTELKRELAGLIPSLKPAHYKVKQVESQIAELEKALERERTVIAGRIKNEFDAAARREKLLTDTFKQQTGQVSDQAIRGVRYKLLKREAETHRQLYESMLQKVKDASVASGLKASNIRLVDRATPPNAPYQPKPLLNAALGSTLGLLMGIVFVVTRERTQVAKAASDRLIMGPGEAVQYVDRPELGVIPSGSTKRSRLMAAGGPPASSNFELVTWEQSRSFMAESFRATATSLLLSQGPKRPRAIVLSSPHPGEGKTTSACNLAIAFSEVYSRVLLVDGDLRRPRVHRVFDVQNDKGLSDLLRGDPGSERTLSPYVQRTKVKNLWVMPSGDCDIAHASLLLRMPAVLEELKRQYEVVVIDAPPLMHIADARLLGRLADGVVLVFRAGVTSSEHAKATRQRLSEDGTQILGTILNDWDASAHQQRYGAYYAASAAGGAS